jgi:hypothetical protein
MREAYLVNNSQSITSIPLYETSPAVVNGRTVQRTQYKTLVPGQILPVGLDISAEKKKYYSQFRPILVELRFRQVQEAPKIEEPVAENEESMTVEPVVEETTVEVYDKVGLMKMRQSDLIKIAASMGLEATTQDSKATITSMILEKQVG